MTCPACPIHGDGSSKHGAGAPPAFPTVPPGTLHKREQNDLWEWRPEGGGEALVMRPIHGELCAKKGRAPLPAWVGLDPEPAKRASWEAFIAAHLAGTMPQPVWAKRSAVSRQPSASGPPTWTHWGDGLAWFFEFTRLSRLARGGSTQRATEGHGEQGGGCSGCVKRQGWLNRLGAEFWWAFRIV